MAGHFFSLSYSKDCFGWPARNSYYFTNLFNGDSSINEHNLLNFFGDRRARKKYLPFFYLASNSLIRHCPTNSLIRQFASQEIVELSAISKSCVQFFCRVGCKHAFQVFSNLWWVKAATTAFSALLLDILKNSPNFFLFY